MLTAATLVAVATVVLVATSTARACDVCAIYTATEQRESRRGFRLGVAEQLTRFTTLQENGHEIDNPGERLTSSITQFVLGYDATSRLGVQLTVPFVTRAFRRREHGVFVSGDETGLGDLSLLGIVRPFSHVTDESVVRTSLLGGLKLPSGSARRLREELADATAAAAASGRAPGETRLVDAHGAPADDGPIGVHGHDLALGSGSVDGIVGGAVFASWKRFYWTTAAQYAIRTEGSFRYRYANDLTWTGGPGWFPYLMHGRSLAVQALVGGEHKGLDTQAGRDAEDTGMTAVYVGPGISFTWGTTLAADLAVDFPVVQQNSAVQIVADYRLRAGVSWRF